MKQYLSLITPLSFMLACILCFPMPTFGKNIKAAFIYFDSIEDGGWSQAHEKGRKSIDLLPDVETTFIENVKESFYTTTVLRFLTSNNFNLIFTTSLMQVKGTLELAGRHPNTVFMLCSGTAKKKNVGNYFGKMYEARYLTGMLAGLKTTSNKIGYVAAFKVPEVIRGINGFMLGVASVNPEAKVFVEWTNSWNNEKKIVQATSRLIKMGIDIISQHQDSPIALVSAQKKKIYTIGNHHDLTPIAPQYHLVSAIWDWSKLYKTVIRDVQKGTWKSQSLWWGLKEGAVKLSPYGKDVSDDIQKKVEQRKRKIIEGRQVFLGPIRDSQGVVRVSRGSHMSRTALKRIDWLVEGIVENNI